MSAYPRGRGDGLDPLTSRFQSNEDRIRQLEIPSGTRFGNVKNWVRTKLAELQETVTDLVADAMAGYYTKSETDSKVANPGNIAPGNVTSSGTVTAAGNITAAGTVSGNYGGDFPGGLRSTGAYNTLVTGGGAYVAAWIHNDGRVGYAPSSRKFKTGFVPVALTIETVLQLQGFYFQYLAVAPYDQAQQRVMIGLLAEDTDEAGFPWLVDYDENGDPFGIRNDLLAVVVLEGLRDFYGQFVDLKERVERLEQAAAG